MLRFGTHRRMYLIAAPLATATLLSLTACGSSGGEQPSSDTGASASTAAQAGPERMRPFLQCLASHGVTLPARPEHGAGGPPPSGAPAPAGERPKPRDMSTPPPGVDQQTWTTARSACASLAPSPPPTPAGS
jgi:predicted small lipoprotein YifL